MQTYGHYQQAYKKAAVTTVDQLKLIVMLYDGALKHLGIAVEKMKDGGTIEEIHNHLTKAKNIISELMVSLNLEKGGEIAKNLQSLYIFMFGQLIDSNVSKDPKPATMVMGLLKDLRSAWATIGGVSSQNTATAQPQMGTANTLKRVSLRG